MWFSSFMVTISWADHSDLVQHVEDFFAKDESALAYSLQRGELFGCLRHITTRAVVNADHSGIEGEDTLRSIVQLLVCIAVNIVSSESKVPLSFHVHCSNVALISCGALRATLNAAETPHFIRAINTPPLPTVCPISEPVLSPVTRRSSIVEVMFVLEMWKNFKIIKIFEFLTIKSLQRYCTWGHPMSFKKSIGCSVASYAIRST